jgi:hypothetical protein
MTTETNLSAEEPSERASTGPQHVQMTAKIKLEVPGGTSMEAEGRFEGPRSNRIEAAFASVILLAAALLLPAIAVAILATTAMAGWLIGVIAAGCLTLCLTIAGVVITRKGWFRA